MDAEIFSKYPKRKFERRYPMKKFLSTLLSAALALSLAAPALTPAASAHDFETIPYDLQVTDDEREAVHAEVDKLVGYVGDMKVGDGTYDPNTNPATIKIDLEKADAWMAKGAQPTTVVNKLIKAARKAN